MSIYPRLHPWETQLAVTAAQRGLDLPSIARVTPFRQYLGLEQRTPPGQPYHWQGSFTRLFAESEVVGQMLAFGNFQLLREYGQRYHSRYGRHGFDREDYLQEALLFLVPSLLSSYDSQQGSFTRYLKGAVIKDLESRVDALLHRESTLPVGEHADRVPAKRQTNRLRIERLERRVTPSESEGYTVGERIEDEESQEPFDSFARVAAISALFQLAGIRPEQQEAITALCINEEKQRVAAKELGITDRTLRTRRAAALPRLQALGEETVRRVLRGEIDVLTTV